MCKVTIKKWKTEKHGVDLKHATQQECLWRNAGWCVLSCFAVCWFAMQVLVGGTPMFIVGLWYKHGSFLLFRQTSLFCKLIGGICENLFLVTVVAYIICAAGSFNECVFAYLSIVNVYVVFLILNTHCFDLRHYNTYLCRISTQIFRITCYINTNN